MSSPAYLLDTNSCIYLMTRVRPLLIEKVEACAAEELAISAIVAAELALGLLKVDLEKALTAFLRTIPVVSFDEAAARAYARVPFKRGKLDRLIAAHALALNVTLVTANIRDFSDVRGLRLEDWTR